MNTLKTRCVRAVLTELISHFNWELMTLGSHDPATDEEYELCWEATAPLMNKIAELRKQLRSLTLAPARVEFPETSDDLLPF